MKLAAGSMVRVMVVLGALAPGGCVTVEGDPGVALNAANQPSAAAPPPPLVVTAREAVTYANTYVGLVEVTFENRTDVWKQVDHVAVDFGSPIKDQSITIASGEDIDAWERATKLRCVAWGPVGLTSIEALGLGISFDTLGAWVAGRSRPLPAAAPAGTPAPPSYPDQHLLTTPFRIPPGLFSPSAGSCSRRPTIRPAAASIP
jgi:hypothetical protein